MGNRTDFTEIWNEIRDKRNRRLQGCDWTQYPDSPLSDTKKTEWVNYRQALRELPNILEARSSFVSHAATNPLDALNGEWVWPQEPS